ncbi:hypothetical protein BDY19DRAFT_580294 [Irpex rosettiformis]|uniref:Uncharacterized protein n=1 Tax=Irpex rosettiformis TaxID=378272 RepID=A0ACB8UCT5_9APHY|nr:hypothetical protein BDY19DRAFT_580294 [Irpex rosettiformis]
MVSDSAMHALAGSAAGIVAMIATFPLVYVSTNAAVDSGKERELFFSWNLDNPCRCYWRGYFVILLTDVCNRARCSSF